MKDIFNKIKEYAVQAYQDPIKEICDTYNSNTENGKTPAYIHNAVLGAAVGAFLPAVYVLKGMDVLGKGLLDVEKQSRAFQAAWLVPKSLSAYLTFALTSPIAIPVGAVSGALSQPASRVVNGEPVSNVVSGEVKKLEDILSKLFRKKGEK